MSLINSTIKPFSAQAFKDGKFVTVTDADLKGKWAVVFFYPADSTPVCTAEVCMFRDVAQDLADAGARVVGVSPQSSDSKARFATRHNVTFPLLADTEGTWGRAFGVSMFFGLLTRRATFLLDPSGKILDRVVADLTLGAHRRLLERVTQRRESAAGRRST